MSVVVAGMWIVDLLILVVLIWSAIAVLWAPKTETFGYLLGIGSLFLLLGPLLNVAAYQIPIRYR